MRSRLLVLLTSAVTVMAPSASAETGKGTLRVSATVVRSCRVSTDAPSVSIDCGTRLTQVQIVPPSAATVGYTAGETRTLRIEF